MKSFGTFNGVKMSMDNQIYGNREFYQFIEKTVQVDISTDGDRLSSSSGATKASMSKRKSKSALFRGNSRELIEMVDRNIIGRDTGFQGPFGPRRSIYMDHTASGQPLRCIENYIRDYVLPYYGNTHTTTTLTSSQTTMYRHEAKDIVRNAVGASEHDAVIFCGSGSTAAINKLVSVVAGDYCKPRPVVFAGPYEHHSNLLPWRDIGAKMVNIPEKVDGSFDMEYLEEKLKEAVAERIEGQDIIGAFSVTSNVTGIPTDDIAITVLMHKYNGLAFWDYSAAAPHVQVLMNPVYLQTDQEEGSAKKDAIYFSGHKLVGGPQSPGVLVAKKSLFENKKSSAGGGGTVFFVTSDSHRYLKNIEFREEGGTPAIIESIRLGLVFRLQQTVGYQNIISKEGNYTKKALHELSKHPQIKILGPKVHPRAPIISFLIEHAPSEYYLHYNFVVALLNDLFGIQSRGGCACAGPYAQHLLGIDLELAKTYENLLLEDSRLDRDHLRRQQEGSCYEIFRPGFTRISIPYHAPIQEVEYVVEAIKLIATEGWKLLPLYTFNPETGEFHHYNNHLHHRRLWLCSATFESGGIRSQERTRNNSEDFPTYAECLEQARNIFCNAQNLCRRRALPNQSLLFDPSVAHLRWFLLPSESKEYLDEEPSCLAIKSKRAFEVRSYVGKEISSREFNQTSVPYQIMQSTWTLNDSDKKTVQSPRKAPLQSYNSGSDINNGSGNERENEFHIIGATVTGPSVRFSIGKDPIQRLSGTNEPVLRKPSSLSLIDSSEGNSVQSIRPDSGLSFTECNSERPDILFIQNNESTNESFSSSHNVSIETAAWISSEKNHHTGQNCTSGGNSPNYQVPMLNPKHNFNQISPISTSMPSYDFQQLNNGMNNLGMSDVIIPISPSPTFVPCPNISSTVMAPCSPLVNRFQQQSFGAQQNQNPHDNFSTTYSYNETSFSTHGFTNTGSQCQSPVPLQDTGSLPAQSPRLEQKTVTLYNIQRQSSDAAIAHPLKSSSSVESPTMGSPVSVSNEDMVNLAMQKITNEIANELKSEIREVISQVEQGIDAGSGRKRANSFNVKTDKRLDDLKQRVRTLSGHHSCGIRRYNSEDPHALTSEKEIRFKHGNFGIEALAGRSRSPLASLSSPSGPPPAKFSFKKRDKNANGPIWHCPPKTIMKPTIDAINEFSMIKAGDRVLVCLSGGKDSLSLLHTMRQMQFIFKKGGNEFSLGAITVDPCTSSYDPKPLIPYLEALGVPYFFEEQRIVDMAMDKGSESVTSICSFCSRMKRGRIYASARKNGYNILAFGQHLDDLAESFFMSVFHNGLLRTMKASYTVKEGDLRVIRPFINVREKVLRDFAQTRGLPVIPENCPACFDAPTERHRVKQLLAQQEILFPKLFYSLRCAIHPLMAIDKTGLESTVQSRKKKPMMDATNGMKNKPVGEEK